MHHMNDYKTIIDLLNKHPLLLIEKILDKQIVLKLSVEELVVLQFVWLELANGNDAPSNVFLAERTGISEEIVRGTIIALMKRKILNIQSFEADGKTREAYDISSFIAQCFQTNVIQEKPSNQMKDFIGRIELEFARKLSPIEIRLIESWVYDEQIDYSILDDALRETILAGVKNLKYMNAIIQDWNKNSNNVSYQRKNIQKMKKEFTAEEKAVAEFDWIKDLGELDE